jgi:hypothetical protein
MRNRCFWCGHIFTVFEYRQDHWLWCGKRPPDAAAQIGKTNQPGEAG